MQHRPYLRSQFYHNQHGTTAIEFAMLSPVIILFILGIIEFALIMFTQTVMESATGITARTGKTGDVNSSSLSREEQLIENVANRTAGLLDRNSLTVTMTTYSTFNNVDRPEPFIDANGNGFYNNGETYTDVNGNGQWDEDMGVAGAGGANDIVVYTVSYPWQIFTPVVSTIIGQTLVLSARTVVKNEPW
jgi:Flp pilus assembly protein TadG